MRTAGLPLGRFFLLLALPLAAGAQKFYTYVGQIDVTSVVLAWGTADSPGNTIGLTSQSHGKAHVTVGSRSVDTERNWVEVNGLQADTQYPYRVALGNRVIGEGTVRTYPERAEALTFFVIGDYGNGTTQQYRVADAMVQEFARRQNSAAPVRFVLTVGDNIYSDVTIGPMAVRSGDEDRHWQRKFFEPYDRVIQHIPFHPTLGNHDGNASENRGDLAVYLDNFFFPGLKPARWYAFSFGQLADFFALDTTDNSSEGPPRPQYEEGGEQVRWLRQVLPRSTALWKIPYFHHPPFTAGPRHPASFETLSSFIEVFRNAGVKVVFTGHEHNFQFSDQNAASGGICYVVSGAGGELRRGNVTRKMAGANIAGWAPENHFLMVEITGRTLRLTPISYGRVKVTDNTGKPVQLPITIHLP